MIAIMIIVSMNFSVVFEENINHENEGENFVTTMNYLDQNQISKVDISYLLVVLFLLVYLLDKF